MKLYRVIAFPLVLFAFACTPADPKSTATPAALAEAIPTAAVIERFIVEAAEGQTLFEVSENAAGFLGAAPTVGRLFADIDAPELARIYLVEAAVTDAGANPWDRARALQAAGGFVLVEPDLERVLVGPTEAERAARGCFWDDGFDPPPTDKAWSLRRLGVPEAWEVAVQPQGSRFGEGIRVCHPDTGWTSHAELANVVDTATDRDLLDDDFDATDPLESRTGYNPGHGTATGSVIASRGGVDDTNSTGPGNITGVAPEATLVPIRTVKSVVQAFDSDVARAVGYATTSNCDVVSMSLGGRLFFGLERAIKYAVSRGLIVVAAAGNCVGFVVAPAAYDDTIAAAATNFDDEPWHGSSHGPAVTISAPGEDVWCARAGGDVQDAPSDGTSFATAEIAGLAALWLAHHGEAAIDAARGPRSRQELFVELLTKTARLPEGWDDNEYGAGIADARALLEEPLGTPGSPSPARIASTEVDVLARMTRRSVADFSLILDPAELRRYGPELSALALSDPGGFEALLSADQSAERNAAASRVRSAASVGLRTAIQNQ